MTKKLTLGKKLLITLIVSLVLNAALASAGSFPVSLLVGALSVLAFVAVLLPHLFKIEDSARADGELLEVNASWNSW